MRHFITTSIKTNTNIRLLSKVSISQSNKLHKQHLKFCEVIKSYYVSTTQKKSLTTKHNISRDRFIGHTFSTTFFPAGILTYFCLLDPDRIYSIYFLITSRPVEYVNLRICDKNLPLCRSSAGDE